MKNKIKALLKKRIVVLDGATGTELLKRGMPSGVCPESWCASNPKVISAVHADYSRAGADIIYTCTFGANRIKLSQYGTNKVFSLNKELASLARRSVKNNSLVAGNIGPTGKFIKPFGELEFEEAVNIFKEQIRGLLAARVDLLAIETMMDIQEARAALIAAKELTDKFTIVTMTFEKGGRTLNGNDPLSALITLQSLGADALGCNCSTGPFNMLKVISIMKPYATVPLVAKPNAGLPQLINNKTVFDMDALKFASFGPRLVSCGANFIGGCCGSSPEHIRLVKKAILSQKPIAPYKKSIAAISSARSALILEDKKAFSLIGEKINPTGKKHLQNELKAGNLMLLRQFAKEQDAQALDVNVGIPGTDEKQLMLKVIGTLAITTSLPLVIDSANPEVIRAALRFYPARALVNSLSGEGNKLRVLLPLLKKYGAMAILLPIISKEMPTTFKQRKKIISKLVKHAIARGLSKKDLVIDGLVLTISSQSNAAIETLKTIEWCSKILKCNTVIGLSNISFGLPNRHLINRVFLTMAKAKGLTLAIANPSDNVTVENKLAQNLLLNRKNASLEFIARYSQLASAKDKPKAHGLKRQVYEAILSGNKENIVKIIKQALKYHIAPFVLVEKYMIPAIIKAGELFEKKQYFLPQLIASAQAMKQGLKFLQPLLKSERITKGKKAAIMLATVEGDVHDIGKNIVALLLENHGFEIVDLGKDVSAQKIIHEIKRYQPDIVGLSALMTTTMVNMKETITLARKQGLRCKFMVGGAVLNRDYADSIGASFAKDGVEAARLAEKLVKKA